MSLLKSSILFEMSHCLTVKSIMRHLMTRILSSIISRFSTISSNFSSSFDSLFSSPQEILSASLIGPVLGISLKDERSLSGLGYGLNWFSGSEGWIGSWSCIKAKRELGAGGSWDASFGASTGGGVGVESMPRRSERSYWSTTGGSSRGSVFYSLFCWEGGGPQKCDCPSYGFSSTGGWLSCLGYSLSSMSRLVF